jgi:hypothetical protein
LIVAFGVINLSDTIASLGVFHAIVNMGSRIHILVLFQKLLVIRINIVFIPDQNIACLEVPLSLLMKTAYLNT